MNLQRKLRFGLLAVAFVLVAAAVPANAQQIYKATVELPFESQWGTNVVEPGQYTITVEDLVGVKVVRLHGGAELAIFATSYFGEPYGDNGKLTFISVNGVYTLKAFDAQAIGKVFSFPVYNKVKGERAQTATVLVASK